MNSSNVRLYGVVRFPFTSVRRFSVSETSLAVLIISSARRYGTIMAIVLANGAGVVLNKQHYSPTTSKIQNILRWLFEDATTYEVYPIGVSTYRDNNMMREKADDVAISD